MSVIDNSLARPWLDQVYFKPLLAIVPRSVTPNTITLSGFAACLGMLVLVLLWNGSDVLLAAICALAVHYYTLADQLDGMQARRTGRASELGAFLDHACDFFNAQIIVWVCVHFLDLGPVWLIAASLAFTAAFLATHLEEGATGKLHFGVIGPLEGMLAISLFLVSYSFAPAGWTSPILGDVTAGQALIGAFIVGLGCAVIETCPRLGRAFLRVSGGPLAALGLAGAAALLCAEVSLFWWIQLGCGAIYSLRALYGPSAAVRALPVLPVGAASLATAILVEAGLIPPSVADIAAGFILAYAALVLLVIAADVRRFFARSPVAALPHGGAPND